jgi:hypothetical protein
MTSQVEVENVRFVALIFYGKKKETYVFIHPRRQIKEDTIFLDANCIEQVKVSTMVKFVAAITTLLVASATAFAPTVVQTSR